MYEIYEILSLDREEILEYLKPKIVPLLKKEIYYKIPIFRLKYENMLRDEIDRELVYKLSDLTNYAIYDIMEAMQSSEIKELLEDIYYDKTHYKG